MASNNRHSVYSATSHSNFAPLGSGSTQQVTTSSLLAALHNGYQAGVPYSVDASTTLVVNSNQHDSKLVVDETLGVKVWEHARRRAEDQTILIGNLHAHTPSLLIPILSTFPQSTVPDILTTAVSLIQSFTSALTPFSPTSEALHHGLAVTLQFNLNGSVTSATISLLTVGLNTQSGLLNIPSQSGYRAFDVFYYLLSAASTPAEREFLSLQSPEKYTLLARSGTYSLPSYLPTADDSAAAEDFRANLRAIGIKGAALRGMLSVLAAILKLGNGIGLLVDAEVVEEVCEEVGGLLSIDPEILSKKLGDGEREILIEAIYEALVDWVITKANEAVAQEFVEINRRMAETTGSDAGGDTVLVTVLELPDEKMTKALCLRGVFDDETGINSEMKEDGIEPPTVTSSVVREVKNAVAEAEKEGFLGMTREKEYAKDRREAVIEKAGREAEEDSFLNRLLFPEQPQSQKLDVQHLLSASRVWWHLAVCPSDGGSNPNVNAGIGAWSAAVVSRQLRNWRLPEWANRRSKHLDFTADFDIDEFCQRYAILGCLNGRDGVESWVMERGWSNGDVVVGTERVWMRENAWWEAEQMLDLKPGGPVMGMGMGVGADPNFSQQPMAGPGYLNAGDPGLSTVTPRDALYRQQSMMSGPMATTPGTQGAMTPSSDARGLLGQKYPEDTAAFQEKLDPELGKNKKIQTKTMSRAGRLGSVSYGLLPSGFQLLCPEYNKVWSEQEVSNHSGEDDFFVSIHGKVYDITKFWKIQHSDTALKTTNDRMEPFAGKNLSPYFPPPLDIACQGLDVKDNQWLQHEDETAIEFSIGLHQSGNQPDPNSALNSKDWYAKKFLPKIKEFEKGDLVWTRAAVVQKSEKDDKNLAWGIYHNKVYDLADYVYTSELYGKSRSAGSPNWQFLDQRVVDVFIDNPGQDISSLLDEVYSDDLNNKTLKIAHQRCLDNMFYAGKIDTRKSARCQANGIILVVFAGIITFVVVIKFLAALQLGSKRKPVPQDKFVICQIPAYTEGEDQLRKALDSLTALQYDNKRKLLCVICDGMVVGGGNDRPTPNIVLDILGVDPKIDPPALPFKSVGEGSAQLNYGKVYSGLYEFEGCVVPYIVVVKVGKPNETSKPGNRGKRDSQVLLLQFLNRVHHRSPMAPLELEMFHQINNIIGVDPELYEFLLMVDADTSVKEDALNRLVAACSNDAKIAGICGETSLENEGRSWWTMIQVYEYYISHHLAKAFESLFGSVTCLPGCFCMYRLRTADKGKPLIIADQIIEGYADGIVDTLHKKNLLSLGEDRFLTTLMTKHFPRMSFKFIPDAYALTAAPETWTVLLSQRRRWINSTIHNLAELVMLKEMCGFCCFSMRFVVFIDLTGTVILPATCIYIGYLIYLVASGSGPFPLFSIIMIAAVYGLQAIIFLVKRQWQHIGWMIIYILAYPIYSFILPIYSFWNQDNFSWGSTRIVLGESGDKQIIAVEDEGFDPDSIPLQTWDEYATLNNLPGRRGGSPGEKAFATTGVYDTNEYEMDDMHSVYSSVKPASTILTGLPQMGYMLPASPAPFAQNRQSTYSAYSGMGGLHGAQHMQQQRLQSMGNMSNMGDYWQDGHNRSSQMQNPSTDNLMVVGTSRAPTRSPLGFAAASRPVSQIDFTRGPAGGPDDQSIVDAIRLVLRDVDLDNVTKKQVRQKVETMLQTELVGERRAFLDKQIDTELANM
ncbi:chitin synthase-domain-containing protein [Kalaharituber pfeilii]|nr:chitin synthase-domain-containing protein [Kalaharituber pfeilii]